MANLALVLSGGGARAAYQAGAVAAIADVCQRAGIPQPFTYYTGISAGAINASMLASAPECQLTVGYKRLGELWSRVESEQVYVSNPLSMATGGLRWIADLSLGGMKKETPNKSLLDPSPLRKLIAENCHFDNIQSNIQKKKMRALAVSALDYFTTSTVTFVEGDEHIPLWARVRRKAERGPIGIDHVLASSAIPLLFPPVAIDHRHFGDGSIRNQSPCGPAISMGANKLIAIGVRKKEDVCYTSQKMNLTAPPSVGRVVSVLLHTLMMDGLEIDIERLERVNKNISKLSEKEKSFLSVRQIDHLWISPSREISEMASQRLSRLPAMVRYLLRGLGALHDNSELASFLLFDPTYCKELIELGYDDGWGMKEQILRLLED